ncbi:hypothetical protein BDV95DRAFT_602289 [Massariosphaeria phaeospora]|uniref:Rho-GAP domain-containing protein n=1 Tax=Massariosphaeria phaeospora TaxID=100035 RepID=A0A7C8IF59_9PLEO|nr:hypothetical protein BDV95DRAFT_602289 [Massariosphaeria phaeospora]
MAQIDYCPRDHPLYALGPLNSSILRPRAPRRDLSPTHPRIETYSPNAFTESCNTPRKILRKMPKSSSLSLAMRTKGGKENASMQLSPRSPGSPSTVLANELDTATPTAPFHGLPESPATPKLRKDSKSIFSNFSATRSSSRIINPDNSTRHSPDQEPPPTIYANGRRGGSTPELNRPIQTPNSDDTKSDLTASETYSGSGRSNDTTDHNVDSSNTRNGTPKPKKQGMLSRSRSIKVEDVSTRAKLNKAQPAKLSPDATAAWNNNGDTASLKTAPLEKGQSWRQNISFGKLRTQSADRHDGPHLLPRDDQNNSHRDRAEQSSVASSSYNEGRGATLMSSLGSGARKMGNKMETARKGVFGKLGRSSSNHERDPQVPKELYQFKIIHNPLVEQTRATRISKRLEDSKDKTEFWMPALPWRCIDYLNMRGCEEEGLYRVPGAAHQVKFYEQKFDQDRDIDLIADDNLNDPNVIGSLFKNWLRNLPDEIFPKAVQGRISQECQGAKTTPQMLKDELSKLPPFNYYLLFAITCHISLLHSCSELNKMNYNNLCICFQPAIKIEAFCFQFLILDWRNCWQGCWTEKEYLVEEVKLLEAHNPQPHSEPAHNGHRPSAKTKGSSSYLGEALKPSTARSNSTDRSSSTIRGISSDRNVVSGRATPPNPNVHSFEQSASSRRELPKEWDGEREREREASSRDTSADRGLSSADSRETINNTPKRPLPTLSMIPPPDDEDNSATPTQAQHGRAGSDTQFRLDLTNPPSSPFSIKF